MPNNIISFFNILYLSAGIITAITSLILYKRKNLKLNHNDFLLKYLSPTLSIGKPSETSAYINATTGINHTPKNYNKFISLRYLDGVNIFNDLRILKKIKSLNITPHGKIIFDYNYLMKKIRLYRNTGLIAIVLTPLLYFLVLVSQHSMNLSKIEQAILVMINTLTISSCFILFSLSFSKLTKYATAYQYITSLNKKYIKCKHKKTPKKLPKYLERASKNFCIYIN